MELNNARKSLIITGLTLESTKKNDMALELAEFLFNALNVQVEIDDIYVAGIAPLHWARCVALSLMRANRLDTVLRGAIFSTAPHLQHCCRWARQRHQRARIRERATEFWRAFTGRVLVCSISSGPSLGFN